MANKIYTGDVGLAIVADCGQEVGSATNAVFVVKRPDGSEVEWTATPHQIGGAYNYLLYVTVAGDLTQIGTYKIQPRFTLSGWTGRGEPGKFKVYDKFK